MRNTLLKLELIQFVGSWAMNTWEGQLEDQRSPQPACLGSPGCPATEGGSQGRLTQES